MPDDDRSTTRDDSPASDTDLLRLDAALLDLRRLFAQPARLTVPDGREVESSTVLVAEAVARLSSADGGVGSHSTTIAGAEAAGATDGGTEANRTAEGRSEGVTISQVARQLHVTPSTASRLVARALAAGAVRADPSATDPRAKSLSLTAQGKRLRDEALRHRLGILDRATSNWPLADRAALADLLTRLAAVPNLT